MKMIYRIWFVLVVLLYYTFGDKEYVHHTHNQEHFPEGVHNADYDKNVLLESLGVNDDFSKMPVAEAKERVSRHMKKIDLDQNGLINKQEISVCIFNYFQKVDKEEAEKKLLDVDENLNNHVEWEEYLMKVYGYKNHEIEEFKQDTSSEMANFLKLVSDDLTRFQAADLDKDGILSAAEYGAFLHPSNYEYMHDYEINLTLSQIDRNGDGFVTFDEYLGDSTPAAEQRIVDHENFLSYDTNLDGKLDRHEIQVWLLPNKKNLAEEEAEHLIDETDSDGDRQLSLQEIVDKYDVWVGSAATQYGDELKRDHSEL